jgi:myo-inositol 2-dehydrogenase/D-chiro-inositol 1-dehydrogenase
MRSLEPGVPPPAGPAWSTFVDRFHDAYESELRAFLRVARGEEESACTARDGLEAVRVAVAATRSLHEHRPVLISEVT